MYNVDVFLNVLVVILTIFVIVMLIGWYPIITTNLRFGSMVLGLAILALILALIAVYMVYNEQITVGASVNIPIDLTTTQAYTEIKDMEHILSTNPALYNFHQRIAKRQEDPSRPANVEDEIKMAHRLYNTIEDVDNEVRNLPGGWDNVVFEPWKHLFEQWVDEEVMRSVWPEARSMMLANTDDFIRSLRIHASLLKQAT